MPTSVKQIFVTSDFTMMLFIYRKAAFIGVCWYLWMDDLSSANMRLLTLVMTTLGQIYHRGVVTFFLWSNSNTSSTEAESGNPPLPGLQFRTSSRDKGRNTSRSLQIHHLGTCPSAAAPVGFQGVAASCPLVLLQAGPTQPQPEEPQAPVREGPQALRVRESSSCPWMKPGIIQPVPVCPSP